jgi:hypothetical protein
LTRKDGGSHPLHMHLRNANDVPGCGDQP